MDAIMVIKITALSEWNDFPIKPKKIASHQSFLDCYEDEEAAIGIPTRSL